MKTLMAVALLVSARVASAGVDTRTCTSSDGSIVMSSEGTIQFDLGRKGRDGTVEYPLSMMPEYANDGGTAAATLVTAIPISAEKVSKRKYQQQHVVRADGTSCDGRETRTHVAKQRYVLTGPHGAALRTVIGGKAVSGLTADGYVVAVFTCEWEFVSSPAGCIAGDGDRVTSKPIK